MQGLDNNHLTYGLNPSYTGKRSLGPFEVKTESGKEVESLNPSYTGKRSLGQAFGLHYIFFVVLTLLILENGLWANGLASNTYEYDQS